MEPWINAWSLARRSLDRPVLPMRLYRVAGDTLTAGNHEQANAAALAEGIARGAGRNGAAARGHSAAAPDVRARRGNGSPPEAAGDRGGCSPHQVAPVEVD